jgi:hypothetical protein
LLAEGVSTRRLVTGKRAETLLELIDQIEHFTLARAREGLTDDEFFWGLYWHIGSMPGRLCDIDLLGGTRTMARGWTSPS